MARPGTVASPLCLYQPRCVVPGEAELGPREDLGDCVNQTFHCLTCGCRGVLSESTELKRPGRFLKIDKMGER